MNKNIESLIKKATLGVITENSLVNFREGSNIVKREKLIEHRKLNSREKDMLDALADKFMKKENHYYLRKSAEWRDSRLPSEKIFSLLNGEANVFLSKTGEPEDGAKSVGIVIFLNTREIKEKLGLSRNTPCWKISEWVWGLFDKAYFIGKSKIFYKDGQTVTYKFPQEDRYFHLCSKTVGKISRRKNIEEEHMELEEFAFIFKSEWSRVFLLSLLQGQFTIFPKPYYRLKDKYRDFVRYFSVWGGLPWDRIKLYSIIEVKRILGLKSKNVNNLKKSIKRILDNLKKQGFIARWAQYGRGWNTNYRIQVKFKKELFASRCLKKVEK